MSSAEVSLPIIELKCTFYIVPGQYSHTSVLNTDTINHCFF